MSGKEIFVSFIFCRCFNPKMARLSKLFLETNLSIRFFWVSEKKVEEGKVAKMMSMSLRLCP